MTIAFTWEGTAVAATRASGAVWTVPRYTLPMFSVKPRTARTDLLGGEAEMYAPLADYPARWSLVIQADCTGVSGSDSEGKKIDAWAEAAAFFDPVAGTGWLGVTRPDASGATVSRRVRANVLTVPAFEYPLQPGGPDDTGARINPYFFYKVEGDTRFPYWCGASLLATDTSAAAAELAISGSTDTVTINNPGARWVGLKLTVKSSSVSGNVDGFTVTNNTNGTFLTIADTAHLVALEYIDWHASQPRTNPFPGYDMSAAWSYGALGNNLRIDPGDNTLQVVRDAGAGTCTLQLSWPSYFTSI